MSDYYFETEKSETGKSETGKFETEKWDGKINED